MDQLAELTEEARKLALDRFRLIQPHLEQNQSLQSVADAAGIPYRTVQRWVAQYRLFGPPERSDRAQCHLAGRPHAARYSVDFGN
jgi:transposase-like protein